MKNKFSIAFIVAAMMMLSVVLTGCMGDNASSTSTGEKIIRLGGGGAVTASVDPGKDWEGWYTVRYGVGETLFKLDKELIPQPWLAEKVEQRDPLTWAITLRDKVTFSNGEKVTATKVMESLKRTAEMNQRAAALAKAEMSAEGDTVLVIKTAEPYATLVNDLTDPYATIIDVAGTKDFDKAPIGTGPFVMSSFEPGAKAIMVKNEKYWGGAVKADKVEYNMISDPNTLAMALQSGEVDIALDLSPAAAASIAKSDKVILNKTTQPRVYQLYFNLEKMQDKAVREAIMYGVDKKSIAEQHLKGAMTATDSAFVADSAYNGKSLKVHAYNESKAKEILAQAGYKDTNGDGIVEKDGKPLAVTLGTYKRLAIENIATEMQAQLKKIGIDVKIIPHEKANFFAPGDFEMALYSIVTTPTGDPYAFLRDLMQIDGKSNFGKYQNIQIQEYLADLRTAFKTEERVALVQMIQQQAIEDAAVDYIGFNNMQTGLSKAIVGYETTPNDYYQVTKDLDKK